MSMLFQMRRCALSTSSVARQTIRVPVQTHGVEGRYASALYTAAVRDKKLDDVDKDLRALHEVYKTNKDFKDFILDPTSRGAYKINTLGKIVAKGGMSTTTKNFLELLYANHRLAQLDAVINSFTSIMRAHRGELFCEVTVAEPLDAAATKQLQDALQGFAKSGQKLNVTTKIDPKLLGGMIVNVGDEKYVDMSLVSKVKKYQQLLESAI